MKSQLNEHQFSNLLELIEKDYVLYAPYKSDGVTKLEKFHGKEKLALGQKTVLPFKKYLIPNGYVDQDKKIAFLGLPLCDVHAIHILLRKINPITKIKRKDVLIISSDCAKDETCFCEVMNGDHFDGFDIFIEKKSNQFNVMSKTNIGDKYLNKLKLANIESIDFKQNLVKEMFSTEDIPTAIINRELFSDFWQKLGNNCFACGACSAVCPLCFCGKQSFSTEGSTFYEWDSCFNKNFSCIQHNHDLRPANSDKIYNWYHHKFVRSPHENGDFLCTGCGRCIKACTASINIKGVLSFFDKKVEERLK